MRRVVAGLVLLLSLIAGAAPARAEWRRAVSTHFIIYSEVRDADLRAVAERLERLDSVLRRLTPVPEERQGLRLTIYMPGTPAVIERMVGVNGAAGFYAADVAGPYAVSPQHSLDDSFTADVILFHEYVHHFMLQHFSTAYPPWFVEGYAELFSNTRFDPDGSIVVGSYATHRAPWLHATPPRLRSILFGTGRRLPLPELYANAWRLTHYLLISTERPGQLNRYINLIASGRPPEAAAEEAFHGIDALERDFWRYRRATTNTALRIRPGQLPAPAPAVIETLSPGEQNLLWQQLEYRRGPPEGQLEALLRRVRTGAAETPNDPAALQLLADVEALAGNYEPAGRTVDALLALRPDAPRALLRKGLIEIALLERDRVTDAERWTSARAWLRRAARAAPDDPLILFEYYRAFERQGIRPTSPAIDALERSFQLVPQSFDLRLRFARELVYARRYREAVGVLSPVAYSAHRGGWRTEAAQRVIDLIRDLAEDAEPPAAALAPPTPGADAD